MVSARFNNFKPVDFYGRSITHAHIKLGAGIRSTIIGPNDSGKTTIAHAICKCCMNGSTPGVVLSPKLKLGESGLLYLPENSDLALTSDTVIEELTFSLLSVSMRAEITKNLKQMITLFELSDLLNQRIITLSGGQRQRVIIAALLAACPKVFLSDEFTSNLDPIQIERISNTIDSQITKRGSAWLNFTRRAFPFPKGSASYLCNGVLSDNPTPTKSEQVSPVIPNSFFKPKLQTLVMKSVKFTHSETRFVLDIPELRFAPGITILLGKNGCGKSTLIHNLSGAFQPDFGCIEVNEKVRHPRSLIETTSLVFQNPLHHFFHRSFYEDIKHALWAAKSDVVLEECLDFAKTLGVYKFLHDDPRHVPQSVRRRMALMMAGLKKYQTLCLDEPTLGLDDQNLQIVANIIRQVGQRGCTVIIATHDEDLIKALSCRCLIMGNGRIVEDITSHEYLNASESRLEAWYR